MGNEVLIDKGALQMALNVLERAGKNEVADELRSACSEYAAHLAARAEWPSEEDVERAFNEYTRVASIGDEYGHGNGDGPVAMRAALQSVRPPVGVVSDGDVEIAGAHYFDWQWEVMPDKSKTVYRAALRRALQSYASRHSITAPTKD